MSDIGMNIDEALKVVDKLLDACIYVTTDNGIVTLDGDFEIGDLEAIILIMKKEKNDG